MEIIQEKLAGRRFHNADQEIVQYQGEPLEWRVSSYGVVVKDEKVLLTKNKYEKNFDLPGGGVALGETPEEALERESVEESGYLIHPGNLIHHETAWFQIRSGEFYQTLRLYFTTAKIEKISEPTDPEMSAAVWASWDDLENKKYEVDGVVKRLLKSLLDKV